MLVVPKIFKEAKAEEVTVVKGDITKIWAQFLGRIVKLVPQNLIRTHQNELYKFKRILSTNIIITTMLS